MLHDEVLVRELVAIDRGGTSAVVIDEITALTHEIGDHSMKCGVLVTLRTPVHSVLPGAQLSEVLCRLWANVTEEFHFEPANGRLANVNVHKDDRSRCGR